ncbi:MAG TPA: membrane protein insertase YidC, partial [Burkholderiales bacterium]|nr:membrane protein insertase YidC [Burkholderiales bacterium]
MDTQRLILFVVFSFSLLLLWEAWQKQLNPPAPRAATQQATTPIPSSAAEGPGVKGTTVPASTTAASSAGPRERLRVSTDTLLAEIDTQGGDIVYLELLKQKDTHEATKNFVLFGPEHRYAAQSGLLGAGLPNHKTVFQAEGREFDLAQGQDKLEVRLTASTPEGVKVSKILTFYRASYRIDVAEDIANGTSKPLATDAYFQITRDGKPPGGDPYMTRTYTGAAVYTEQSKLQKVTFEDIDKGKISYPKASDDGWIAMIQHYFVAALLPPEKTPREFYTRKLPEDLYSVGVIVPLGPIAPGADSRVVVPLYAGPQDQDHLQSVAPGLQLVVD